MRNVIAVEKVIDDTSICIPEADADYSDIAVSYLHLHYVVSDTVHTCKVRVQYLTGAPCIGLPSHQRFN